MLILIDGHALGYTAYHALPKHLSTSDGQPTNAVYGFTSSLVRALETHTPSHVAVAFDTRSSFRSDLYPDYKAHRGKMPDAMRSQMGLIESVIRAFGFPTYSVEGYEADDVLGTITHQVEKTDTDTVILTCDHDLLQLVSPSTRVWLYRSGGERGVLFDTDSVCEKYGFPPYKLPFYKALVGDRSDNIPGVYGIGKVTARRLLSAFDSVPEAIEHIGDSDYPVSGRYTRALSAAKETATVSHTLATIKRDAPISFNLDDAAFAPDYDAVVSVFKALEFRSLLSRIPDLPQAPARTTTCDYATVRSEDELRSLVTELADADIVTLDTETTSANPMKARLCGIGLSSRQGQARYVPILAPDGESVIPLSVVQDVLGPLLADPAVPKCGHNLKYDVIVLEQHGMRLRPMAFDTMVAGWLLNPSSHSLGLKSLAFTRLGERWPSISAFDDGQGADVVPLSDIAPYCCADADMTHRLMLDLSSELSDRGLLSTLEDVEMPLNRVLADVIQVGIRLDTRALSALSDGVADRMREIKEKVYDIARSRFNIRSTHQLSDVLFGTLGLPTSVSHQLKSGHWSTKRSVLKKLDHPIADLLLAYKRLSKLHSTYTSSLPRYVASDGRVHSSFKFRTSTGRLRSSRPNLQNIPTGQGVREAFVPADGCIFIGADYSQVELRVLAHISGDPTMMAAFRDGQDIHARTASDVFNVPLASVTPSQRSRAKAVNFATVFGQGAYGLSRSLGISKSEAAAFIDDYFSRFFGVRAYVRDTKKMVKRQGYVETILGRRRYFPLIHSDDLSWKQRTHIERQAINTRCQGSAADIIKIAMIRLHRAFQEQSVPARILLQIHDELIIECNDDPATVETVSSMVKDIMESAYALRVPLVVDLHTGYNWGQLK